jgi:hypothetical protein
MGEARTEGSAANSGVGSQGDKCEEQVATYRAELQNGNAAGLAKRSTTAQHQAQLYQSKVDLERKADDKFVTRCVPKPAPYSGRTTRYGAPPPIYFCLASHLSNCAISFFCATMICLAMAFISGDLPLASSISAMFNACWW